MTPLFNCKDDPEISKKAASSPDRVKVGESRVSEDNVPTAAPTVFSGKEKSVEQNILHESKINNIEDIYQSIHDLLINPNQRKKLGNSARKRALEDFNWDIVTKKYLDAINN